jgi:hypothetical protein
MTSIIILANNNIELFLKSLSYILVLFEDNNINAISTRQKVKQRPGLGIID